MKPADTMKTSTTKVLDRQTLEEAYEHSLYALAAYGKEYAKGKAPHPDILIKAGFPPAEAEAFAKTHTILDQYDSWTGLSVVAIRNDVTGQVTVAPRGTEPATVADLLTDTLIALGVPEQLNPQYRALKDKMDAWMADGTLPDRFTIAGHSLGMYLAGSLMQDFGEHVIEGFGFNEPGSGGGCLPKLNWQGNLTQPKRIRGRVFCGDQRAGILAPRHFVWIWGIKGSNSHSTMRGVV